VIQPDTLVQAQYSVPFCVAACAIRGPNVLIPMEDALLEDVEVIAFAKRIRMEHADDIEALFPARSPARATITTRRGMFTSGITDARGEAHTPLSWDDLEVKFLTATRNVMTAARQQEMLAGMRKLGEGCLAPLRASLRDPLVSGC